MPGARKPFDRTPRDGHQPARVHLRLTMGDPAVLGLCVSCGASGACRLGLTSANLSGSTATFALSCPEDQSGAPGIAPGSWTAGVFDEVFGRLPILMGVPTVTSSLTVMFDLPVPVATPLTATSRVIGRDARRWDLEGVLQISQSEVVLARGTAHMIEADPMTAAGRLEARLRSDSISHHSHP